MLRAVVAVMVMASSAQADTLFSAGAGAIVEPVRYKGPGDLDPAEIELSDRAVGVAIPLRVTWTQDQQRPHALGVTAALTLGIAHARVGYSGRRSHAMLEVLGRVAVHRTPAWSLYVGAGGAVEQPLGTSDDGILANENVEPFTTVAGGIVSASFTLFGANRDYVFDLRAGVLASSHVREIPVLLTASAEWGRD